MKPLLFAGLISIGLYSCKKADVFNSPSPQVNNPLSVPQVANARDIPDSGNVPTTKTVNLYSKKTIDEGDIIVTNDGINLFVTITMQNGYLLKKSSIYLGTLANAPVKNDGKLDEGHFPFRKDHHNVASYTLTVPLSSLPDCFIIIVKGETHNGPGNKAWAEGQDFPGSNKGTYFDYCKLSSTAVM